MPSLLLFFIPVYGHCLNLFNNGHQQWVTQFPVPQQSSLCHCCETQTRVLVNLRAASLPGKLIIKPTGDKLSLLHLCSCVQVSGLGEKSTKVYVHLFIRAQEIDYCLLPCFHLHWKVKINLEVICILIISSSEEKKKHFSLSKVIVDTHLTCDWLWLLETWGEHFFAITMFFCSSWQYPLLSNISEKSIQIKVSPPHNFVLYLQHRKSLHQVSLSTHLAQSWHNCSLMSPRYLRAEPAGPRPA